MEILFVISKCTIDDRFRRKHTYKTVSKFTEPDKHDKSSVSQVPYGNNLDST